MLRILVTVHSILYVISQKLHDRKCCCNSFTLSFYFFVAIQSTSTEGLQQHVLQPYIGLPYLNYTVLTGTELVF